MKTRTSRRETRGAGLRVGVRGLMLALYVLALTGAAYATGSGTLDRVSGWYLAGTNLTVTATPDVYSQFDYWSGDTNGATIADEQVSFVVDSGRDITAVFRDGVTESNAVPWRWLGTVNPAWTNDFEGAVTNDWDEDGFTTAEEYWAGTDPTNSESLLRIDSVQMLGGEVRLVWQHARVDSNIPPLCVQVCTNLMNRGWQNAAPNTNAPVEGVNVWQAPYSGVQFYRLIVPSMP